MMKTAFLVIGLIGWFGASSAVHASENCHAIGEMAESIMKTRQKEIPITAVMDTITKTQTNAAIASYIKSVVIMAYRQPAMRTLENQLRQVAQFRNEHEFACFQSGLADQ